MVCSCPCELQFDSGTYRCKIRCCNQDSAHWIKGRQKFPFVLFYRKRIRNCRL